MKKGGYHVSTKHKPKMSSHVAAYYTHLMNSIDTGCPMRDYCAKDVYVYDIVSNMI